MRADNPFVDTTEYIMNKMIQRQAIVPPWIEKQQELLKALRGFRTRLRDDWKRQAARSIARRGGTLHEQVRVAKQNAASESFHNPRRRDVEDISVPTNATTRCDDSVGDAKTSEQVTPPPPIRLPSWAHGQMAHHAASINALNSLTRSYNLMAPDLAKKGYFSLQRELDACFADVAPLLAAEIERFALTPSRQERGGAPMRKGGMLSWLNGSDVRKEFVVHRATRAPYGFREWWRDVKLWGRGGDRV